MIQKHIDKLEQEIKDDLEMIELLDSKRAEKIKNSSEYQDYITSKEWEETRRLIFKKYDYKLFSEKTSTIKEQFYVKQNVQKIPIFYSI
jgi:hypothetical protein